MIRHDHAYVTRTDHEFEKIFYVFVQQLKEMINHLEQKVLHIEKQNEEILVMLKSIRECQKRDAKKHFTIENSPYKVSN